MKLTETSERTIVNVVDQFDYSTQNDAYNRKFRKWRENKHNPYAFNFRLNRKESVFIEGKGFENKSAVIAEQECLGRIINITGIAMLMWVLIDNVLGKLVVAVLDKCGLDLHTSFFSTAFYGGSTEIVSALIIIIVAKIMIPAVYIHKKMKMPKRIEHMSTLNHPLDLVWTLCMTMAVSAIASLPNIYTSRTWQMFNYFRSINLDLSVWDQEQFVLYTIFDIIVISVMSELFFRGAVFTALRQFGDLYAVIITSAMTGLLYQDFREFPAGVLISLVASIGMLRSGTVLTAIFAQMVFKMYQLALVLLEESSQGNVALKRNAFVLIVFIIGVAGVIVPYLFRRKRKRRHLAAYKSDISLKQRCLIACKSYPIPAVICLCLLSALIKIFF